MIHLADLTPAAEEGWWTLFELAEENLSDWVLIGGQAMHLIAVENGAADRVRLTEDVDVVVDVQARPRGTEWLAAWLRARQFTLDGVSTDGIGHRFVRKESSGYGTVTFDVLAPEGLGERTERFTVKPARTVQVPGSRQAFNRSFESEVTVAGMQGGLGRSGSVSRPSLLGMLIAKAAATGIAGRTNPERDWQDSALLLSLIAQPDELAQECDKKDRQRLRRLEPLEDRGHPGWENLGTTDHRSGVAALSLLINPLPG